MTTHTLANGFKGHVLIIGGGIGGNSLALFLKNVGISSTVYEAYAYKDAVGGGLGLREERRAHRPERKRKAK